MAPRAPKRGGKAIVPENFTFTPCKACGNPIEDDVSFDTDLYCATCWEKIKEDGQSDS
jgi:hypothetical protein